MNGKGDALSCAIFSYVVGLLIGCFAAAMLIVPGGWTGWQGVFAGLFLGAFLGTLFAVFLCGSARPR
ncbi:MAG: hypothetical protein GDA52_11885 [Rhodobacteraceae bacterium]|nr:hypothetical protein [Paracoccaceae bacterium]